MKIVLNILTDIHDGFRLLDLLVGGLSGLVVAVLYTYYKKKKKKKE